MMSSQYRQSLGEQLPEELMSMIFSELTVVELARAQQTCKRWYRFAQQNSPLWKDVGPLFSHVFSRYGVDVFSQQQKGQVNKNESIILGAFNKLNALSKNKLDGILLHLHNEDKSKWDSTLCEAILKAMEQHPPTRLKILIRAGNDLSAHCFEVLGKNKSLKHLSLDFGDSHGFFRDLKLDCSLESLDLKCGDLSNCRNHEDLIKALKNVSKLKLNIFLKRPENLDFLGKIGQNLEYLELTEKNFNIDRIIKENKFTICFPKLLKLVVESISHQVNRFCQLNCPQLQVLIVIHNWYDLWNGDEGCCFFDMLNTTESLTYVSIIFSKPISKAFLECFFNRFLYIEELSILAKHSATFRNLVATLPKTVSKMKVRLELDEWEDTELLGKIREIYEDENTRKARRKCKLICELDVNNRYMDHHITIFGITKLRALVNRNRTILSDSDFF